MMKNTLIFLTVILFYTIFILYFFYYLFYLQKKTNKVLFKNTSLIKNKEYLFFKNSLIKIYYSTLIILFCCIFKHNGLNIFLDLNIYFIYTLFTILIIYSILLSNSFNLKLFKLYLEIKNFINLLNDINFISFENSYNNFGFNKKKYVRNYSTSSTPSKFEIKDLVDYVDLTEPEKKDSEIINFKKNYKGGYLGYLNIQNFGDVSHLNTAGTDAEGRKEIYFHVKNLEIKIKDYLADISEDITYTILPVLRFVTKNGDYKTVTISKKSIKVTRNTSYNLLAYKIVQDILEAVFIYDLVGTEITLFVLDRPWLAEKDFNRDISEVTKLFNKQIDKDISSWESKYNLNSSDKVNRIKNYKYLDTFMDKYGEPVYDKQNNLIGYKLNEYEYATIETYYNDDNLFYNLLSNKILIKDFNTENLSFVGEVLISWVDTKTEFGFIRELDNIKYFYDLNN